MKKLLCSACLLGVPCRYDGKSKPIAGIEAIQDKYELYPVCPEVLGGLSTPRPPCEISCGKVVRNDGEDLTRAYISGAKQTLIIAKKEGIQIALLKERSPSCGVHVRYDGSFQRKLIAGKGVTTSLLEEHGITVFSEEEIEKL